MFIVAQGHKVKVGGQEFLGGKVLPPNRDYTALIKLGAVIFKRDPVKVEESPIVAIVRKKVASAKRKNKETKAAKEKKPKSAKQKSG